ncbi:hypothetical protein SETIT_9G251700v2 [Setaria italica]|uniref:Transposase Tnp1/En/Spm-like domain-containing protein n=1 Tax=Setaria italica TaxID=4555 RepID=A0A368SKH8_SETIT|nr:hypothetical protein SETIT_9G251700v2 [Setaria italica]
MCTLPQMKCSRRHPPKTIRLYLVSKQLPRRHIFRVLFMKRTQRVKASSLNRSESSRYPVYLLSLRYKGRIVAKAKLGTTDAKRNIGGSVLGKEYVGVYVEGLENVDSRNKGDKLIPRPIFDIRTLIDDIGYIIPWPRSHKATSTNLKQPGDVTFQGISEAAMERGAERVMKRRCC